MDYATLGSDPISEENPAGSDVRYDPDFELVQEQIDKLSSPTASGQVDWHLIAEKSANILRAKSKDMTVAGYFAVASVKTRQIEGLDDGIAVLKDVVVTFWDNLFPKKKRMRGRSAAISWWLERTEAALQTLDPPALPQEQVTRMVENLKTLDGFLADNMPDAPLLRPLQRIFESFPVKKETPPAAEEKPLETAAEKPADAEPAAAVGKPPAPRQAAPAKIEDDADMSGAIADAKAARRSADAAFQRLRQVSLFFLNDDLKNPLAYRYRRMAAWGAVTALPPSNNGDTQIPPPAPQVVEGMDSLRDEGKLAAFILNSEQKLSQFIFWFDINRMVAESLIDLGIDHQKAADAVCEETAFFVQRLPGIESLRFSDGTPFADAQTQQWLHGIRSSGAETKVKAAGASSVAGDAMDAVVQKARALARKKQMVEAVEMLQEGLRNSKAENEKLRWRLAIAGLLLEAKKPQSAWPHLEQVLDDVAHFHLEMWNPPLAVEGMTAAWQALSVQTGQDTKEKADRLIQRIARVDPAAALRLTK